MLLHSWDKTSFFRHGTFFPLSPCVANHTRGSLCKAPLFPSSPLTKPELLPRAPLRGHSRTAETRSLTSGPLSRIARTGPVVSSNVLTLRSLFTPEHIFSMRTESTLPAACLLVLEDVEITDWSTSLWKDEKLLLVRGCVDWHWFQTDPSPLSPPSMSSSRVGKAPRQGLEWPKEGSQLSYLGFVHGSDPPDEAIHKALLQILTVVHRTNESFVEVLEVFVINLRQGNTDEAAAFRVLSSLLQVHHQNGDQGKTECRKDKQHHAPPAGGSP